MNIPNRFHQTPHEAIGESTYESIVLGQHTIRYTKPASLDQLFDHPAVRAAFAADEYIPYWADVWPASLVLAEVILEEPWAKSLEALEIGCGLGIAGIAGLIRGLNVTFSDIDATAVELAGRNALANDLSHFQSQTIDLRMPPPRRYPVLFGADVMYEARLAEPLVEFLYEALTPDGLALIVDPDRYSARPFRSMLERRGFQVQVQSRVHQAGETNTKINIYRIQKR